MQMLSAVHDRPSSSGATIRSGLTIAHAVMGTRWAAMAIPMMVLRFINVA